VKQLLLQPGYALSEAVMVLGDASGQSIGIVPSHQFLKPAALLS
jgi:hypothetical protein